MRQCASARSIRTWSREEKPRRSPGHIVMMGGDVRRNDVDELAEEGGQAKRPPIAHQRVADERGARSRREGLAQHRSFSRATALEI